MKSVEVLTMNVMKMIESIKEIRAACNVSGADCKSCEHSEEIIL